MIPCGYLRGLGFCIRHVFFNTGFSPARCLAIAENDEDKTSRHQKDNRENDDTEERVLHGRGQEINTGGIGGGLTRFIGNTTGVRVPWNQKVALCVIKSCSSHRTSLKFKKTNN